MPDLSTSAVAHIFEIVQKVPTRTALLKFAVKNLVVSFSLDPIAWGQTTEKILPGFIVAPNKNGEGDGWQPPIPLQRIHP